jgi:hypothetical protein
VLGAGCLLVGAGCWVLSAFSLRFVVVLGVEWMMNALWFRCSVGFVGFVFVFVFVFRDLVACGWWLVMVCDGLLSSRYVIVVAWFRRKSFVQLTSATSLH